MPRSHALQPRQGSATAIAVRVPDGELLSLERLARRSQPKTTVSEIVREAIKRHLEHTSGRSPFRKVFARLMEDLADNGVHPIIVGGWAVAAHGYLTTTESFDVVVRDAERDALARFLAARGIDPMPRFPFAIGIRPWCVRFRTSFGGVPAEGLPTQSYGWDQTALDVITLDGLLTFGKTELPDYTLDALRDVKAGRHHLDDGERGIAAWDAVGRFTASAYYPDPLTREPHDFIDFRIQKALRESAMKLSSTPTRAR